MLSICINSNFHFGDEVPGGQTKIRHEGGDFFLKVYTVQGVESEDGEEKLAEGLVNKID